MKPRARLLLVLLACGAVAGLLVLASGDKEPAYQGKTLKQWMNTYCWPDNPTAGDLFRRRSGRLLPDSFYENRASDLGRREQEEINRRQSEAADAVRHIGTNAIPALLEWEDKDARVAWKYKLRANLPQGLQGWHFVDWWLIAQDHYRVDRALYGFYILGSNATPAVPELARRMNTRNSDSGVYAAVALANMGGAGLPALISALTNTHTPNRVMVARSVANATRAASNDISGIVVLAQHVRDADAGVGATAAMELGFITSQPGIAVPALVDGLHETRGQIRARSADALGYFGPEAKSAVPALLGYLNDPDPFLREYVTRALQKIAPETLKTNATN